MARKTGLLRLFSGKNSSDKSSAALSTDSATGILTGKANAGRRNLAIFASGAGSNAKKIIEYFRDSSLATVALIVSNKADAGVLAIAKEMGIPTMVIEKEPFFRGDAYSSVLERFGIHFIILAGFLWKVPEKLIRAYPRRIINIHPALLPQFGGKGMYGAKVHEAVLQAGEKESGITIHYVDELYDHGDIIFQARCPVYPHDNPETLADRIHELEHASYPRVIADLLLPMNKPD